MDIVYPRFYLAELESLGLIKNDTDEYALTVLPVEVVADAARIYVEHYSRFITRLNFSKKKRVKSIMENIAVVLTFNIEESRLMNTAQQIYHEWFGKMEVFGDIKRQNKYLRRFFKQISAAYSFTYTHDCDREAFQIYTTVLCNFLDDFSFCITKYGRTMEFETWRVLIYVSYVILGKVLNFKNKGELDVNVMTNLRRIASFLMFTILPYSGISDKYFWDLFKKFSKEYTQHLEYVKCGSEILKSWTRELIEMIINGKECQIYSGVYNSSHKMERKTLEIIIVQLISSFDFSVCSSSPHLMLEIQKLCSDVATICSEFVIQTSDLFKIRFPGVFYLNLYGNMLSLIPINSGTNFFESAAITVQTALRLSNFDFPPNSNYQSKLITYASRLSGISGQTKVAFISASSEIVGYPKQSLAVIAEKVADYLYKVRPPLSGADRFQHEAVICFATANSIIKSDKESKIFNNVLGFLSSSDMKFKLMCAANPEVSSVAICDNLVAAPKDFDYVHALTTLAAYMVQYSPDIVNEIAKKKVMQHLKIQIDKTNDKRLKHDFLWLSLSLLTYARYIFDDEENLNDLKSVIVKSSEISISEDVKFRISLKVPSRDLITKIVDSSSEASPEHIANLIGIGSDFQEHYITINDQIIICLIDSPTNMAVGIIARGPFGKVVWRADQYLETVDSLSTTTQVQSKFEPAHVNYQQPPLDELREDIKYVGDAGIETLEGVDFVELSDPQHDEFTKEFEAEHSLLRPRVIDLLLQLGLLTRGNSYRIKVFEKSESLTNLIEKLDHIDSLRVIPVRVLHVTGKDTSLEFSKKHFERISQCLLNFLKTIGTPFNLSKCSDIPPLRTAAPCVVSGPFLGALVSPAMAKDEEGAKIISSMNAPTIIFNESGRPLNVTDAIVVSPAGENLYCIESQKSPYFPLCPRQVADIVALKNAVALIISTIGQTTFQSSKDKSELIQNFAAKKPASEVFLHAISSFSV